MSASNQLWRRAAQNPVKFTLAIVVFAAALLAATLLSVSSRGPALKHAAGYDHATGSGGLIGDVRDFLRDPLAYFATRSPGARGSGQLIQSKHRAFKLARHAAKPPHERVLSNVRYAPPIPPFVDDIVPRVFPGPDFAPPFLSVGPGPIPGVPVIPPPVVPISNVPGGGAGGGPGGNTLVPEPATWFMLIWGMGLIGCGVRSKHRHLAKNAVRIGFRARV